jgi:hypothetical protein
MKQLRLGWLQGPGPGKPRGRGYGVTVRAEIAILLPGVYPALQAADFGPVMAATG